MARVFFEITGNREYIFTSIWIKYNNNAIKAAGYNTCGMGWLVAAKKIELVSSTTHQDQRMTVFCYRKHVREEPVRTRCAPRSPAPHLSSERETGSVPVPSRIWLSR
ncbi:hypothetical protein I7I50_09861 [Histoplasma capsulatum G186AR]|uniref:Uncharacterized protein n=1 Tax=Ajellomyces capsulatus TaxID=5037 RepID=A0A8H8D3F7_AJECA|nr:hypothetical protein I7I52_10822 [Histoplasma capsulatum]QSS68781.1 hypothetical protein I7I50_09861 [Histoplasma capsulatum G186AR]